MTITKVHPDIAALVCLLFLFLFSFGAPAPEFDSVFRQAGVITCTSGCAFFVALILLSERGNL